MEKLKSYYAAEAESQPEPSINITFEPVSEKRVLKPIRRTVLLVAVVTLIMASALAAGAQWLDIMPRWFSSEELYGEEGGNIAQTDIYAHPFSAEFRAYIDANDLMQDDSWDGQFSYSTIIEDLEFYSMVAVSDYFNVNTASNSLMPEGSNEIYATRIAYDPIYDNAHITVFSHSKLENNRLVSVYLDFRIDDELNKSFEMNQGFYEKYGFGVEDGTEQRYTSPTNGIEALMLPFSPNSAQAIFVLDNIIYTLTIGGGFGLVGDDTIYNLDIDTTERAVETLIEIIDAYHR